MNVYIYGMFDPRTPDTIVYVGQSSNLHNRFKQHQSCKDKQTGLWVQGLLSEGVLPSFKVLHTADEYTVGAMEATFIQSLKPKLNTRQGSTEFVFEVSPIVSLAEMEGKYIRWALDFFGGNKKAACKALAIGRQTLYNRMKAHGIELR